MAGATGAPGGRTSCSIRMRQRGDHLADDAVEAVEARQRPGGQRLMQTLVSIDQPVPEDCQSRYRSIWRRLLRRCPNGPTRARSSAASNYSRRGAGDLPVSVLRIAAVGVRGGQGRAGALHDRPARNRCAPASDRDRPVPDERARPSAASSRTAKAFAPSSTSA